MFKYSAICFIEAIPWLPFWPSEETSSSYRDIVFWSLGTVNNCSFLYIVLWLSLTCRLFYHRLQAAALSILFCSSNLPLLFLSIVNWWCCLYFISNIENIVPNICDYKCFLPRNQLFLICCKCFYIFTKCSTLEFDLTSDINYLSKHEI